jgi:3-methyladenine DNA glycosylase AlkD
MSISYLHPLVHSFNAHANTQRAQATAKYFKNNFEFYGFDAKTRRQLIQSFYKQQGIGQASQVNEICYWAFNQHEREWQYFAMEHAFKHRKHWTPETIQLIHFMLITKSWWDTVDYIATHCVSFMALQMPKLLPTIHQWNQDQNIWLIRTSIIYQNLFKKKNRFRDPVWSYFTALTSQRVFYSKKPSDGHCVNTHKPMHKRCYTFAKHNLYQH